MAAVRSKVRRLPNVVGMGIGYKEVGGETTPVLAITVLVSKKVPVGALAPGQKVPGKVGEVPTDVIEVGDIRLLGRTDAVRPAVPGTSIGHYLITAGTFGLLVHDVQSGEPLILSNNHVLANISDGNDGRCSAGDPVWQPGRYDGGTSSDQIGTLLRFVPIYRDTTAPTCPVAKAAERLGNRLVRTVNSNYRVFFRRKVDRGNLVDAALAKPLSPDLVSDGILELGRPTGIAEAGIGQEVVKSGRTSGLTRGTVRSLHVTVRVGLGDVGYADFRDQILTTPIAQPGDSGSAVLTKDLKVMGLLSAGSDQATIAGRIQRVFDSLSVQL